MLKNYNFHLFVIIFLPMVGMACFQNFFLLWGTMEVQTLSFVLLAWSKMSSSSGVMSFLLVQMLSSILIFFCILLSSCFPSFFFYSYLLVVMLFLKMGMMPFHFWALHFINFLDCLTFFLFVSFMSIIPFLLLLCNESSFLPLLFLMNMSLSSLLMFFYGSYKKIIFFSSLFLSSMGLMLALTEGMFFFLFFFCVYFMLTFFLLREIEAQDLNFIFLGSMHSVSPFLFAMVLMILGMPMGVGFLMKMVFLQVLSHAAAGQLLFPFFLFISSVIMSYHYMKLLYLFFNNSHSFKNSLFHAVKKEDTSSLSLLILFPFICCCSFVLGFLVL